MDMTMEFKRKLPTPLEVKRQFPVTPELAKRKEDRDREIREIFEGKSVTRRSPASSAAKRTNFSS